MADLKATLCGELPQNEFSPQAEQLIAPPIQPFMVTAAFGMSFFAQNAYFFQNAFNLIRFRERERGSCWVAGVENQTAEREGYSPVESGHLPRADQKTGPPFDFGGIDYGRFEGDPSATCSGKHSSAQTMSR